MKPRKLADRSSFSGDLSINTIKRRIGQWTRNVIVNEFFIRQGLGANILFETVKDIPCILVGAGPSLDKNIDQLQECKDFACVIACDAVLKPLLEKGIYPHICLVVDSDPIVREHFEGIYDKTEEIILVADSFIHPSVHEDWLGQIFWYNIWPLECSPFTASLVEFTGQIGILGAGGNVLTVMFCLAYGGLKCRPIIFVGSDNAFYNEEQDHVANCPAKSFKGVYAPTEVEDIYNKKCFTNNALLSFNEWFEDIFTANPGIFVNATEGGILTNGCICMSLQDAKKFFLTEKVDIKALLSSGPIIDVALPENRWTMGEALIVQRSTYFPKKLIEFILQTQTEEDLILALNEKRKENSNNTSKSTEQTTAEQKYKIV